MYQDSNLHGQMSKKLGLPQNHVKRNNISGQTQQQACHYHLVQAVFTASQWKQWSLAGALPGEAAILPFFPFKDFLFFPHHLTVFHRVPQCDVASLTGKSRGGRGAFGWWGERTLGKAEITHCQLEAQDSNYLLDKYSLRVITLFQLCNDINKLGIQGITRVGTNNWIFYCGMNRAQACLRVKPFLKLQHTRAIR